MAEHLHTFTLFGVCSNPKPLGGWYVWPSWHAGWPHGRGVKVFMGFSVVLLMTM